MDQVEDVQILSWIAKIPMLKHSLELTSWRETEENNYSEYDVNI